jgi:predicted 2-oxoglutarate/Fe(II)-dependent dioxygenase YbiX
MINTPLKDYVKVYKGFYDPEFCATVTNQIAGVDWHQHAFYDHKNNEVISHDHELSVSSDVVPAKAELDAKIWHAINRYITEDMKFMADWYGGWNGYSNSRFNRYVPETKMKLHCDHIQSLFDGQRKGIPTITVLGSLNNDYEGGELVLCGENYELKTGDVILFPSNFLYPHEVKPVKSGVRYSFVSWVW